eukprot:gene12472-biopygen9186
MENSGALFEIKGLRKKWKELGDAIAQVAPVEDRFTVSVVVDAQTRCVKCELFAPGILWIYTPSPQKWDEYFSTSITSVRMEDSSLHEKVLQALSTPVRNSLCDDSADTSEADSVVEAAQELLHVETSQGLTEASLAAVEARLTTKNESQMEQLTQTIIARLSPATAPPSATSGKPVPPGIAAKEVGKEADLFPDFPVVDIAAWKGLLEPASARGRRAILRDGLMEDAADATDGPLLNDLFVDLLGLVEGAARTNWVALECSLFVRVLQRFAAKVFFLSSRALRGSSGKMLDYINYLRDKNVFAAPSTFRDKTNHFVQNRREQER